MFGAGGTFWWDPSDPTWGVREGFLEEVVLRLSLEEEQESEEVRGGNPRKAGNRTSRGEGQKARDRSLS